MYPVSAAFIPAITAGSYTRALLIQQLDPVTLNVVADLTAQVIEGSVEVRSDRENRRTTSMVVQNPNGLWTPRQSSDPFYINNPIRVWLGIVYQNGTTELAPLGTFLVNRGWATRSQEKLVLEVDAIDLWKKLQYGAISSVKTYAAGSSLGTAIIDILSGAGITNYNLDPSITATNLHAAPAADLNFAPGTARADMLGVLAQDYGLSFWFDPMGLFVARPSVDPTTIAPVGTMSESDPLVIEVAGGLEDSPDIKNHVGVMSTNPDVQPIYQEAFDSNVNSPTYYLGSFGDRFFYYEAPWIQTIAQASATAKDILRRKVYQARKSEWAHGPRPELDVYDVLTLTSPSVGIQAKPYYLDQAVIPLSNAEQRSTFLEVRSLP